MAHYLFEKLQFEDAHANWVRYVLDEPDGS